MQLAIKKITQDEYPCAGVRILQDGKPKSDVGKICCGITRDDAWQDSSASRLTIKNKGWTGCTSSSPCPACEGDCDSDSDCAGHLKCFQRNGNGQGVPGCSASGLANDYDYCYDPTITTHVDASHCNFRAEPRPVWMTSLRGTSSHWNLAGVNSFHKPSERGFDVRLLPVAHTYSAHTARTYDYQVQWCGVGVPK